MLAESKSGCSVPLSLRTSSSVLVERPPASVAVTATKYFPLSVISSPSVVLLDRKKDKH